MGEFADDLISQILDDEDFGMFDEEARWSDYFPGNRSCKYCGKGFLHWEMDDEGWRLYDEAGKPHRPVCSAFKA